MKGSGSKGSGCTSRNKWAPLSYPSAAIFAPPGSGGPNGIGRAADPFFPLHRDVLLAAMRELLILDGRIDPTTMKILLGRRKTASGSHLTATGVGSEANATAGRALPRKRKKSDSVVPPCGSDDDEPTSGSSASKKQRTQNASVDSLVALQEQATKDSPSHPQPHLVPFGGDQGAARAALDHTQFDSAEDLVCHVVKQAVMASSCAFNENESTIDSDAGIGKEGAKEMPTITSKRKVSDVDTLEEPRDGNLEFAAPIVRLVRSNIMTLQTSHSGTKLSKLATQSAMGSDVANPNESADVDRAIVSFLHNPKLQREQQKDKANQTARLVLPRLLEVAIEDEYNLRAKSHHMVSSMIDSFPGNVWNTSLRTFLGYKSAKTPGRERILEILSDVLFDVSHAMYAWIHTEGDMERQRGHGAHNVASCKEWDVQIKASLFDDRALKRIGGFEPSSLLPLALGIHRCRRAGKSWEEYAVSEKGKAAMGIHLNLHEEAITENEALLELGRKRRGRRGRSIMARPSGQL